MKYLLLLFLFACTSDRKGENIISIDSAGITSGPERIILDSLPMAEGNFTISKGFDTAIGLGVIITDSTHFTGVTWGEPYAVLNQGEDTVHFPLHPDYKEYIFWWTMTSWHEYTYRTSLLYLKSKPSQARLKREANRIANHLGYDSTTVVVRECIGFNPEDGARWDKADKIFEKQFLATIK